MFTLTILAIVLTPCLLLTKALQWERQRNRRNGVPNLEHIPLVMGYHMHKARRQYRYDKYKAKYDALKFTEE